MRPNASGRATSCTRPVLNLDETRRPLWRGPTGVRQKGASSGELTVFASLFATVFTLARFSTMFALPSSPPCSLVPTSAWARRPGEFLAAVFAGPDFSMGSPAIKVLAGCEKCDLSGFARTEVGWGCGA